MFKVYRAWQLRREVAAYHRGYNWAAGRLLAGIDYYRIEFRSEDWHRITAPSRIYSAYNNGTGDAVAKWRTEILEGK